MLREPCAVYVRASWDQGDGSLEQFDKGGERLMAGNGCRQRFWLSWEDPSLPWTCVPCWLGTSWRLWQVLDCLEGGDFATSSVLGTLLQALMSSRHEPQPLHPYPSLLKQV